MKNYTIEKINKGQTKLNLSSDELTKIKRSKKLHKTRRGCNMKSAFRNAPKSKLNLWTYHE